MYLKNSPAYYRGTQQVALKGPFLLLVQLKDKGTGPDNTYAIVRKVAMQQCGQFLMGRANICGKWATVSGTYGNDGLPMDVDRLPTDAVALPVALYDAWSKGGGWNSAGSEASAMRQWARETFRVR
jgi:hypothetical protein